MYDGLSGQFIIFLKYNLFALLLLYIFFFFFFLIQFNVPFKIISLIETSQSKGGRNGRTPGKPPDTPASRTWLVSHVASAGLELAIFDQVHNVEANRGLC